ncbi:hypothetical protein D5086_000057 [Populus alba]|uniref:Uncharacterized protein n=4 Tax=Populus TaxID=3689 RepID=A0ACC4CUX0_POPAL|nr:R2R3 MYB transcription factor MYB006 [Populus alba x Populus x berolinensis]TKS01622.1 putative R2R3 MYB transcription factor MYB006 [Populus alba]UBY06205.1 MYB6 [Populus tremula x Populus alba]
MRKPTSATAAESAAKTTPCCIKVGLKRGPWTPEEDELLVNYIKKEGEGRWRTLPKKAGLLRCGKSCRLRWMNYLRPSVKRGQIADDEEDLILRLHRLLGNRWSLIAGRIPGRTDNEIKNYWNTHLSKKLISQGIDPRTHKPLNPQSFDQSKPSLPKANLHQARLKEPIKNVVSSGLEEATSGSPRIINRENEYFQNNINAHLDDQYHADHFIASHGYTSLLNYDGTSGMDLRGDQRLGIGEADQDINSGTDDVFSFLNSLINEEALQQHQILNVPNVNCAPPSSDPLLSIAATTFGLGTGWESTLMSSDFNQNDSK